MAPTTYIQYAGVRPSQIRVLRLVATVMTLMDNAALFVMGALDHPGRSSSPVDPIAAF